MRVEMLRAGDRRLAAWPGLLRDAAATPFQTPEWLEAWSAEFGREEPRYATVWVGHDLVGFAALGLSRGAAWRTVRALGTGPSDYLAPLVRRGFGDEVRRTLWEAARSLGDLLDWQAMPASQAPDGVESSPQATCLRIALPSTFEAYLGRLGKSLRYDIRGLERRSDLRIERDSPAAADAFFDLHRRRWRRRGLPGAFTWRIERFQRRWLASALAQRSARVHLLWEGERCIGALYALIWHDVWYYYQAGFDPEARRVSPGTLLLGDAIRCAIGEGATTFDLLRGDEAYKRRWKPDRVEQNVRLLAASNARGVLGLRWIRAANSVEEPIRARFEGRGLW